MIEKLTVEIPPILVNDVEFAIKPITFELRKDDTGIYYFTA